VRRVLVIGTGERLFHDRATPTAWKPINGQALGLGGLIQHYERTGYIAYARLLGT
jgi:hypothetical protein